jgi:hypothetical protein
MVAACRRECAGDAELKVDWEIALLAEWGNFLISTGESRLKWFLPFSE